MSVCACARVWVCVWGGVSACLRALTERDRLVVLLTFYAEREAPRIAEDLGVTPGAVRVIRHRAMARLRGCVLGDVKP